MTSIISLESIKSVILPTVLVSSISEVSTPVTPPSKTETKVRSPSGSLKPVILPETLLSLKPKTQTHVILLYKIKNKINNIDFMIRIENSAKSEPNYLGVDI